MDMEFLTKIFAASHETAAAARWLPWAMIGFAAVFGYATGWAGRGLRARSRWERFVAHNCRAFISYRRHLPAEAADRREHLAHQAACLVVLSNAINLVHPDYQNIEFAIIGGVILIGVIVDEIARRIVTARREAARHATH